LFFLPPIALAIAYMFVARRLDTRTQKARVIAIALAILVFQVVGTIQFNPATPANSPMFALLPLISALMGLLVLATYKPPAWLARAFHIEPLHRVATRNAANGNGHS
jgi:TctA family transporter